MISPRPDRVRGRHEILPPAEELGVVMLENCGHLLEIQSVDRVEGETLIRGPERDVVCPYGLCSLCENRPKALRTAMENSNCGIELESEAGGGRGFGRTNELVYEGCGELAEVGLKVACERSAMRLFTWKCRLAVDNQPVGTVKIS